MRPVPPAALPETSAKTFVAEGGEYDPLPARVVDAFENSGEVITEWVVTEQEMVDLIEAMRLNPHECRLRVRVHVHTFGLPIQPLTVSMLAGS